MPEGVVYGSSDEAVGLVGQKDRISRLELVRRRFGGSRVCAQRSREFLQSSDRIGAEPDEPHGHDM